MTAKLGTKPWSIGASLSANTATILTIAQTLADPVAANALVPAIGDVVITALWTSDTTVTTSVSGAWVEAVKSVTATGTLGIAYAPAAAASSGDYVFGAGNTLTNGYMRLTSQIRATDPTTPLQISVATGTGATMTGPTLTAQSEDGLCFTLFAVLDDVTTDLPAGTTSLAATSSTAGTDYAGRYVVSQTRHALGDTIGGAVSTQSTNGPDPWWAVTIEAKQDATRGAWLVVAVPIAWTALSGAAVTLNPDASFAGAIEDGDLVLVVAHNINGGAWGFPAGWTEDLETAGHMSVGHIVKNGAIASGSLTPTGGSGWGRGTSMMLVKQMDVTVPIEVAGSTMAANNTMQAANVTAVRGGVLLTGYGTTGIGSRHVAPTGPSAGFTLTSFQRTTADNSGVSFNIVDQVPTAGSNTPGALTQTINNPRAYETVTVYLRDPAPINKAPAPLSASGQMVCGMTTFAGATYVPVALSSHAEMVARMRTRRPNYVAPRRAFVWVTDLKGDQVNVLS